MRKRSAFVYSSMIIGFLIFFLSALYIYNAYQSDRIRVIDRLHFNASFVDLWLTKSFYDSSLVLEDMVDDLSSSGLHSKNSTDQDYQRELDYLREKEDALPNATSAFIVNKDCLLTHSKGFINIDLSQREYCRTFKAHPEKTTVVTLPFTDLAGRNVVVQGQKITNEDNEFLGMIGISTNLTFFNSTISQLDLPSPTGIAILSSNLKLLSSVPKGNSLIGKRINVAKIKPEVFEALYKHGEVVFNSDIYNDGSMDTIYARKIKDLPFIIVVTRQQDYLRTMVSVSLLTIVGCFFVIIGLLLFNLHYVKRTKEQKEKYSELAYNDYLTGINNRRSFDLKASQVLATYRRKRKPFSIIMCDIDNFKEYNDQYGHEVGDIMITAFAEACLNNLRDSDILGRFGGDEFVILVPEQNCTQALLVAKKLQEVVRDISVLVEDTELTMTCSMGVSTISDPKMTIQELLNIADNRLYEAKESGRNCVRCDSKINCSDNYLHS
ncbi:sensor domain-containing diguanylate cyclase [Aliivibrio sifiae]|uniref:diguanylate cyclase n=1 Tax=Aliivibrio sifiae TaxID=566293 RepID=A0A2S7X6Z8_9GAMM|nr:diguanylate cyclase [Aliivibrio sifiae]PQJ86905.1 GGDEF domain-containing protein [Aliivibrio sifiae]GLR73972.1 GGDEF domain-containing protein [Aliivibrio sifiae]